MKRNNKISFVLHDCPKSPNGGTKVIYEYAEYLSRKGYTVTIYYNWAFNKYHLPLWVRKVIINCVVNYWPTWFHLDRRIKRRNVYSIDDNNIKDADIVIATDIRTAVPVSRLAAQKGKKCYFIQDYENWDNSDNYVNYTYSLGMTNITVANWLKKIADRYGKKPAICVSNSINTDIFNYKNLVHPLHSIAFHYRSDSYKGCEYAIEAVRKLKEKYLDLEVFVVGREDRPKELPDFCSYKKDASAEEVADINNHSTVFICSSTVEGFGLPGLEAMACGCVLVSTRYDGVLEYAKDEVNALLSPIKDADGLVRNTIRIFEDEKLRNNLSRQALLTAESRTLDKSCLAFEQAINM